MASPEAGSSAGRPPVPLTRAPTVLRMRPRRNDDASPKAPTAEPAGPAESTRIALDVKALQHRAFERGREVERQESSERLATAARELTSAAEGLRAARASDREEIEVFAVRLATTMAEELVARAIDQEGHDVKVMAQRALDQVLPDLEANATVELHAHPDDVARLPRHFTEQGPGPRIEVVPDSALSRGSFRVVAGGGEFYAGINERLETMRERLLEEVRGDARA